MISHTAFSDELQKIALVMQGFKAWRAMKMVEGSKRNQGKRMMQNADNEVRARMHAAAGAQEADKIRSLF